MARPWHVRPSALDATPLRSLHGERNVALLIAEATMPDPVDALVIDLLEWIGPGARPYSEVIDAWRTSCPRLPVWEEANARGYIVSEHRTGAGALISLSSAGRALLNQRRGASQCQ
jgi:hypothetical protein